MATKRSLVLAMQPVAGPSRLAVAPCTCVRWRRKASSQAFPVHSNASPFEILNLPRSADQAEIKDRYYELAKIYHPDTPSNVAEAVAKERYRLISDAYALLKDPLTRQAYLRSGSGWGTRLTSVAAEKQPRRAADPVYDTWDPGVNADSPFSAYSGHSRATYQSAYAPGADWNRRAGYSRSSDEAAKRARYFAAAQREAQKREAARRSGEWPFSSVASASSSPLVYIVAFAAFSVTLVVASRSSPTVPLETLPDDAPAAGSTAPLRFGSTTTPEWSRQSINTSIRGYQNNDMPPSNESLSTSVTLPLPSLPSRAFAPSGSSSSPLDNENSMPSTGQQGVLLLPRPTASVEILEKERDAERAYHEALQRRQSVLRDEKRSRSFARVDE